MAKKPMIILCRGGIDERTIPINQIQIPDLYKVAERLGMETPDGILILEAWAQCHAMKEWIQEHG